MKIVTLTDKDYFKRYKSVIFEHLLYTVRINVLKIDLNLNFPDNKSLKDIELIKHAQKIAKLIILFKNTG